jgi:hypothetical protein
LFTSFKSVIDLRVWYVFETVNIGDAHSERLIFSTHHKKSFDFSCCCECFKIFNHGLICLVFVNLVRLFLEGLLELSVWVLYTSVILTVSGLKSFSGKSFRFAERFFCSAELEVLLAFSVGFFKVKHLSVGLVGFCLCLVQ